MFIKRRSGLAGLDRSASAKDSISSIHDIKINKIFKILLEHKIACFDQLFSFHLCEHLGHV
jgi:hypothetical protein